MEKLRKIEELSSSNDINTLYTNFKAELLAASLVESGYDEHRIALERRGVDANGFIREIEGIKVKYPSADPTASYFSIQTGRKSIYDTLPEGIFHGSLPSKEDKSKEDMLEEISIHRTEEFYARRFFSLYEMEIDKLRVQFQLNEILFDKKTIYLNFTNTFVRHWNIIEEMNGDEALRFVIVVAHINSLKDDDVKIAKAISFILENDVTIYRENTFYNSVGLLKPTPLSEMILSVSSVLSVREDKSPKLNCSVSNLDREEVCTYLEDGRKRKVLENLLFIFTNSNLSYNISLSVLEHHKFCELGGNNTYLGINTYLNI